MNSIKDDCQCNRLSSPDAPQCGWMVNCRVAETNAGGRYAICERGRDPLGAEQDVVDLIGFCAEAGVSSLLLDAAALSPQFFDLRTGVAGMMLQKFVVYGIRVALVMPNTVPRTERFAELITESNRGASFRVFENRDLAEAWLMR